MESVSSGNLSLIGDLQEEVIRLRNISDHTKISSMLNEEAEIENKYTILKTNMPS